MLVKDNHPTLRRKIQSVLAFSGLFGVEVAHAQQTQLGRGRVEVRRLRVAAPPDAAALSGFAGVAQVFWLERERRCKKSGQVAREQVVGMTSLAPEQASPQRLLTLLRRHWHIENKSHYVRDVTFAEDASQVRTGNLPQVLSALRNAAISLMRLAGHKNIAAACRFYAAQPEQALQLLGCPIPDN